MRIRRSTLPCSPLRIELCWQPYEGIAAQLLIFIPLHSCLNTSGTISCCLRLAVSSGGQDKQGPTPWSAVGKQNMQIPHLGWHQREVLRWNDLVSVNVLQQGIRCEAQGSAGELQLQCRDSRLL